MAPLLFPGECKMPLFLHSPPLANKGTKRGTCFDTDRERIIVQMLPTLTPFLAWRYVNADHLTSNGEKLLLKQIIFSFISSREWIMVNNLQKVSIKRIVQSNINLCAFISWLPFTQRSNVIMLTTISVLINKKQFIKNMIYIDMDCGKFIPSIRMGDRVPPSVLYLNV